MGLRRSNDRRARGLADETILSETDSSGHGSEALKEKAAEAREELGQTNISNHGAVRGGIRNLYARLGEAEGGVYATPEEAMAIKGDSYSKFGEYRFGSQTQTRVLMLNLLQSIPTEFSTFLEPDRNSVSWNSDERDDELQIRDQSSSERANVLRGSIL